MDGGRLEGLYRKYGRVIFSRCCRLLRGDKTAAEDATQEVFLRVAVHIASAPSSEEALLWIYRIATNYCLNELRSRKRRPTVSADAELLPDLSFGEETLINRDFISRIVARVPERLRVPAWLHHVDGLSHEEVGKMLGISRRTVINYLAEFDERLRKFARRAS